MDLRNGCTWFFIFKNKYAFKNNIIFTPTYTSSIPKMQVFYTTVPYYIVDENKYVKWVVCPNFKYL